MARRHISYPAEREMMKRNKDPIAELSSLRGENVISTLVRLCFIGIDVGKDLIETFPEEARSGYIGEPDRQLYEEFCKTLLYLQDSVEGKGATSRHVLRALMAFRRALP